MPADPLPVEPPAGLDEWRSLFWRVAVALLVNLRDFQDRPPTPPVFPSRYVRTGQVNSPMSTAGVLYYVVVGGFEAPKDADVTIRRHHVTVGGADRPAEDTPVDQAFFQVNGLAAGDELSHAYSYVDANGNESGRSPAMTHTVVDDVAPSTPSAADSAILATGQYNAGDEPPAYSPPAPTPPAPTS